MKYLSKNPNSEEEHFMNQELINKYNIKVDIDIVFDIAKKLFLHEIHKIGIENIIDSEESNFKFSKIRNRFYTKNSSNKLKLLFTTDYLKESFFKDNKRMFLYLQNKEST